MRISIITITHNSALTLRTTIESVLLQTYPDIEYIIVDGASTDGTIELVSEYEDKVDFFQSNPDKGIYDALNKGISLATGEVVGILHSDDFFTSPDVIATVVDHFQRFDVDSVFGDVCFVNSNSLNKIVRYYSSRIFCPSLFRFGLMPAHPSFYVKRSCYEKYGGYSLNYSISSDFDLLIRFLYQYRISYRYIPINFVTMRTGGKSTSGIKSTFLINKEDIKACKKYGIRTNWLFMLLRYPYKFMEYL